MPIERRSATCHDCIGDRDRAKPGPLHARHRSRYRPQPDGRLDHTREPDPGEEHDDQPLSRRVASRKGDAGSADKNDRRDHHGADGDIGGDGQPLIAARNPKNAHPEARKSANDRSLLHAAWSRVSMVAATATPLPHSSTTESARNVRVRSRWRSHPSAVNAPSRRQAPPKAHDSTRVAVLKAPCSIRPNPRIAATSPICEAAPGSDAVRHPEKPVDQRTVPSHDDPMASITASATWEVPTAVGSSRSGFMS